MAKSHLSIELDDLDRIYFTGEHITGVVVVRAEGDTKCKGLRVSTPWRTHGRGNVVQNKGNQVSLFEGTFQAGREYRFDFDLPITDGPSTYHGHYLNIDHYIKVQMDVPWAFDPKAEQSFRYMQLQSDDEADIPQPGETHGCVKGILVAILVGFGVASLFFPPLLLIGAVLGLLVGVWWFFRRFLPARALGEVTHQIDCHRLAPGEAIAGELCITPPRDLAIEGVQLKARAIESCTSGSGTNSTTHRHTAYEQTWLVAPAGTLPGGQLSRLKFAGELPDAPLFSVTLSDNTLIWSAELRILIPRWPDWIRSYSFIVLPPYESASQSGASMYDEPQERPDRLIDRLYPGGEGDVFAHEDKIAPQGEPVPLAAAAPLAPLPPPAAAPAGSSPEPSSGVTFSETIQMIWAHRDDREQRDRIIDAVSKQTIPMAARVQRREFFGGVDEHSYENGYSYRAVGLEKSIALILFIRHDQASEFEQLGGANWEGEGTIVGFCDRRNRVLVRVE